MLFVGVFVVVYDQLSLAVAVVDASDCRRQRFRRRCIIWSVGGTFVIDFIMNPMCLHTGDVDVVDFSNGVVLVIYFVGDGVAGSVRRRRSVVSDVLRIISLCRRLKRRVMHQAA